MSGPLSRGRFYFREQGGRCYLRITQFCKDTGGLMVLLSKDERRARAKSGHKCNDASWDHIFPKPRSRDDGQYQLLACVACNNFRGSTPPKAEHIALAQKLHEEFKAQANINPLGAKAQRRAKRKEQRSIVRDAFRPERKWAGADLHPRLPAAGYDEPLSLRIRRMNSSKEPSR